MRKFKINKSIVRAASVLLSASMMLTPMAAYAEGEPAADPTPQELIETSDTLLSGADEAIKDAEVKYEYGMSPVDYYNNKDLERADENVGDESYNLFSQYGLEDDLNIVGYLADKVDNDKVEASNAAASDYNEKYNAADTLLNAENGAKNAAVAGKNSAETVAGTTDEKADANEAAKAITYADANAAAAAEAVAGGLADKAEADVAALEQEVTDLQTQVNNAADAVDAAETAQKEFKKAYEAVAIDVAAANLALDLFLAENNIDKGAIAVVDGKLKVVNYTGDAYDALDGVVDALNRANDALAIAEANADGAEQKLADAQAVLKKATLLEEIKKIELEEIKTYNDNNGQYEWVGYDGKTPSQRIKEADDKLAKGLIRYELFDIDGIEVELKDISAADGIYTVTYTDANGESVTRKFEFVIEDATYVREGHSSVHWLQINEIVAREVDKTKTVDVYKNKNGEEVDVDADSLIHEYGNRYYTTELVKTPATKEVKKDVTTKFYAPDGTEIPRNKVQNPNSQNPWYRDKNGVKTYLTTATETSYYYEEYKPYSYSTKRVYVDSASVTEKGNKCIYSYEKEETVKTYYTKSTKEVPDGTEMKDLPQEYYKEIDFYNTQYTSKEDAQKEVTKIENLTKAVEKAQTRVNNIQNAYDKTKAAVESLKNLEKFDLVQYSYCSRELEILKSTLATAKLNLETAQTKAAEAKSNAERARANASGFKYNTPSVNPGSNPDQPSNDEEPANDVQPTNTVVVTTTNVTPAGTPIITTAPVQEVEITEEPAPLAETPAVTETVVEENKTPLAAPEVTVTEEPAPLAEAPVEKARISWLWLLVILALVAAAAEGFRRYMKKAKANK